MYSIILIQLREVKGTKSITKTCATISGSSHVIERSIKKYNLSG